MVALQTKENKKMISIKNLSHKIGDKHILKPINLEIPAKKLTALIGPNGAGKSTLLNIIGRLLTMQSGEVFYDATNLQLEEAEKLSKILAILPQENHIVSRIKVEELLSFGRYPYHKGRPSKTDLEIIEKQLTDFDLLELRTRYLDQLSGGQKQRTFLAMIFCQTTPYILLDEPLNNLDVYHENNLLRLIKKGVTENDATVVIVLHDINQAIAYADNIVAMKDGEVIFTGAPTQVINQESIYQLYNLKTDVLEHKGRKIVVSY